MTFVPNIAEETKHWLVSKDIVSKLYDDNIIMISWPIQMGMTDLIIAQLLYLYNKWSKKMTLYINTPGWEVYSGMWIIDTIEFLKKQWVIIETLNIWLAASMWSLLLTSWSKWHRISLKNSVFMIHQPLGWAQWQATDIQIQAEEILRIKKNINEYLSNQSWLDMKEILSMTERDNYMTAEEAKEKWFIDIIL